MLKINYYLGLNDMDAHVHLINNQEAHARISDILDDNGFSGATLYDAKGLWYGESENSVIIEIIAPWNHVNDKTLAELGYALQKEFNPLSVMMSITKMETVHLFDALI